MKNKMENLRKVQLIQLEILKEIVKICDRHKITYYLIGGTLIGAVRHKGFIPWDDDIDIAIPRKEYDRLIEVATKELPSQYKVVHYTTDEYYQYYLINIIDTSAEVTIKKVTPITSNVWIDILPIDGIPNNRVIRIWYKFKVLYYRALVGFINIDTIRDKKRSLIEKILIKFAQITQIGKKLNIKKIRQKNDKLMRKYDVDDCRLVGTIFGNYGFHEIVPKKYFGKGSKVTFEGIQLNAPEKVDEYLTHMYGNYMQLPPKEKQVGHHIMDVNVKNIKEKENG